MERLFLECTLRAALLVGGTAIVLYAMRVKPAAVKHRMWTGVLALMLVLPIWTTWGPKVSLGVLPALPPITVGGTTAPSPSLPTTSTASTTVPTWGTALLGIYLLGLCVLLIRLGTGTLRARRWAREAVVYDGVGTSRFCAAPVTVGFLRPVVILPEHWHEWPQAKLDMILTHEREHAARRDSLVQFLALLNRAVFWFHPAAWWLERNLSALAEQACDDVVLGRGHSPRDYAEYLIDIARSMARSGARVNLAGMGMPGTFLPERIRKILEAGQAARISRARTACAVALCAVTSTAFAAGRLDHAAQGSTARPAAEPHVASAAQPSGKFVLGDLIIEGDAQDVSFRDRTLRASKDREYGDINSLSQAVVSEVREDFLDRGFFRVVVSSVGAQMQDIITSDGKRPVLMTVSVEEGEQYHFGTFVVNTLDPPIEIPPPEVAQGLMHLKRGDLFDMSEVRAGFIRLKAWYAAHGALEVRDIYVVPEFHVDDAHHVIDLRMTVTNTLTGSQPWWTRSHPSEQRSGEKGSLPNGTLVDCPYCYEN